MRTKIHWAMKSQQPLAMAWTVSRENGGLIPDCATDKNLIFLLSLELLLTLSTSVASAKSLIKLTVDRT